MAGESVTFVVPFRVRFSTYGMVDWVHGALPVFWHHWSELTDIRRIPLDRRWRIFWNWWVHRPRTLPVPLESKAVEWWLSRRMRGQDWEWDETIVSDLLGTSVRGQSTHPLGSESLRPALREFLCPQAFADFLDDELSQPVDDHNFLPPVSCLHLRLRRLAQPRPGWIVTEMGGRHDVEWLSARMQVFRFGDGFLTLRCRPQEADSSLVKHLKEACRSPDSLRFRFSGSPVVSWDSSAELGYRELVEDLLLPSAPYEPDRPDREQWSFVWGDDVQSDNCIHRIEMPLLSRLPILVVRDSDQGLVEPEISGPMLQMNLPRGADSRTSESRALAVFLLALFRHLKVSEVAELLATPRGRARLESAQYLQYLSYHLSLVHDRFQTTAPVFGGWAQWTWRRLSEEWNLDEEQGRISRAIHTLREDYFRGLSLRLIARVTSTFWFLFRWILLPFILVKMVVFLVSSLIIAAAGIVTLSLFATAAVILATRLHGRIKRGDREDDAEPELKARPRTDWVMMAAVAEVGLIAAAVIFWPDLRRHLLPLAGTFAGLLVLITVIGFWTLRKRWRRDTVARFYLRETVPIVAVVLAGLSIIGLLVVLIFVVSENGVQILNFWPKLFELIGFEVDPGVPDVDPGSAEGADSPGRDGADSSPTEGDELAPDEGKKSDSGE